MSSAGDWNICGDRFYEKAELYQLAWDPPSFSDNRVACAGEGGPVAVVRDERRIVLVTGGTTQPVVKIFTAAGAVLGAFVWDKGHIVGFAWTSQQELVIVDKKGEVHLYSMHGSKLPRQFSLGSEAAADGIEQCMVYGLGLVALTATQLLWAVDSWTDPRPQKLASAGGNGALPHTLAVVPPAYTLSGCVEVLLAIGDSITVVDADSAQQHAQGQGPILALAVAPNGGFVAGFSHEGRLLVWTADFSKVLSEFQTDAAGIPRGLAWCGTDSVVLCLQDALLMVGPYGDAVHYEAEGPLVLTPEIDGVHILTAERREFLRRVPDALEDVFRIGSTSPGATLYDVRKMFDACNVKADEALRSIVKQLPEAVSTCLEAAGAAMDPARQAALLKAAVYGRAFCSAEQVSKTVLRETAIHLQLLNALRAPDIGIPLTMRQLQHMTVPILLEHLVSRHLHLLALRVAASLGLKPDSVLVHWACAKIQAAPDMADDQLLASIDAKLQGKLGIRYAAMAAHAQSAGRMSLAAALLDREPCAAEQVPLLLELGEGDRALSKAADAGDPDLVYLALFKLYRARPLPAFLSALASRPLARSLFLAYCSKAEPELYEQVLHSQGNQEGLAELRFRRALSKAASSSASKSGSTALRAHDLVLADALKLVESAGDAWGQNREHGMQAKGCQELVKLRRLQAELETETGNACFLGLSAVGTVRQCLKLGNVRAANRVRLDMRMTDRRFSWLKIYTLASNNDWEGLELYGREKKLPVAMDVFIAACKQHSAPAATTAKFIARLPDSKEKAEEYAAIGMLHEAALTAAQSRDSAMLSTIQGMVGSTTNPLGAAVMQLRERLNAGISRS